MASSIAAMAMLNNVSRVMSTLQVRVDSIEKGMKAGSLDQPRDDKIVPSVAPERVSLIESNMRDVTKSINELRNIINLSREEVAKERSMIETTLTFKIEQLVNRSVKERVDMALNEMKAMNQLKNGELEGILSDRMNQLLVELEEKIMNQVSANANANVNAMLSQKSLPEASIPEASIPLIEQATEVAVAPEVIDTPPASEAVSSGSEEAPTPTNSASDFANARRKIIRGAKKPPVIGNGMVV